MKLVRIVVALLVAATGITFISQTAGAVAGPNDASYWEDQTEHPAQCYKHDPPDSQTAHGFLTNDGLSVQLEEFDQNWPGDHWELLVVKGGNSSAGDGNGNLVYHHPEAGTDYDAPLNDGGQQAEVSHWIVCKGTTPDQPDLRLNLTAECAVGDTLYWRVTNDEDVAIDFTWDGPGDNDGAGTATANSRTYFTTTDAGGANTTKILWDNPSGNTDEKTKAHNNQPCVYHVSFEKQWSGSDAPDLDGATLLTAESSLGTATCTSDDGALSCVYSTGDDLEVPFGETYTVTESTPDGWTTTTGTGSGFTGITGFDADALPDDLVYDIADDRYCTSDPDAEFPFNLEKFCDHTVTNDVDQDEEVEPSAPTFTDPTCDSGDADVTLPDVEGVTYSIDGTVAPGETVTVTATAQDGYVLTGTTEWEHTFPAIDELDCDVSVTPMEPAFVDPTCDQQSVDVMLPDQMGVAYSIDGTVAPGETVTVAATADDGFVLTGTTEWQHTFGSLDELDCSSPPEPSIDVAAFGPTCQADTPYIDYRIETSGTDAEVADLFFFDLDGNQVAQYLDVPLTGQVVYPGASPDPNPDWPGWKLDNGLWVEDDTDSRLRDGLTVTVEVNPTAEADVEYPPATADCNQPEQIGQAGPTTTTPQLPATGSNNTSPMVVTGIALLLAGLVLLGGVRRFRPTE